MNLLTSEDKTLDLPMVVAEWNKKIPQKNIRWSTDAMQVYLDKYLHENFGDLYAKRELGDALKSKIVEGRKKVFWME